MGVERLKELLVSQDEILENTILESLRGLVSLDNKNGEIYPTDRYTKLRADAKICVYLIARKAAHLLGLNEADAVSAKTIRERTGMPMGTVNPNLRALAERGIIGQNDAKEYYIPPHGLALAREIIREGNNEA